MSRHLRRWCIEGSRPARPPTSVIRPMNRQGAPLGAHRARRRARRKARACAIPQVAQADTPERLKDAVAGALSDGKLATIVAKVEAVGPKSFHMDLPLLENRFQFKRALEALRQHG